MNSGISIDHSRLKLLIGVGLIPVVFIFLQLMALDSSFLGFSYWFLPDSISNLTLSKQLSSGEIAVDNILASLAVPLYYSLFSPFSFFGFFCANIILFIFVIRHYGYLGIYIPLLLFPYYLQSLVLPSEDILVLISYFLVGSLLIYDRYLIALACSLLAYFVRDGGAVVLCSMVISSFFILKYRWKPLFFITLCFLLGVIVSFFLDQLADYFFIFSRNLYAAKNSSSQAILDLSPGVAYIARIFFNLTNPIARLPFLDSEGSISIASIFIYLSGLSTFVCLLLSCKYLNDSDIKSRLVSFYYFLSILIISVNPLVQSRYQFPIAVLSMTFLAKKSNLRVLILMYSVSALLGFSLRLIYTLYYPIPDLEVYEFDFSSI